ncbi:hypothetical protein NEIFLAOT_01754 [Neisseria flavescens NRL30031/H210]|uniref:Uncharacterized protein n=1 Tax=Neisseria flavescens NRL30031/H210 TaxID=546264 RepID=C0EP65_NEIFL|nr:hypothetical protein NEIFLAOT_01754 [Neisseria flavescens NRL30031/H210]
MKTFVLIDPYKFFSNAKRSSEPDSDDLIHVFLTENKKAVFPAHTVKHSLP